MKLYNYLGLVALAGAAATSSVASGEAPVAGSATAPTLAAWSTRVFRDLDHQLISPVGLFGREPPTGIVAVKFNCSESGAPAGVAVYKSSGSRVLDAQTVRAVQRIATLHPLPMGMSHGQQFIVRVLFAPTAESADRQMRKLRQEADQANAWFGKQAPKLAAAIELVPAGG